MTLRNNSLSVTSERSHCTHDISFNWDTLYSSQIWSNSNKRRAIINTPFPQKERIKYCYTCRGKIRNYQLKSPNTIFAPCKHSTPKGNLKQKESYRNESDMNYLSTAERPCVPIQDITVTDMDVSVSKFENSPVPTISEQLDRSSSNKYVSTEYNTSCHYGRRRLRKSIKGLSCIVNFALTDSPKKKRTQIQACSIGLMIIAIVIISLILVNFTSTSFINANNTSTNVVPTNDIVFNETTSAIVNVSPVTLLEEVKSNLHNSVVTEEAVLLSTSNHSHRNNILAKLRKNIRTYRKNSSKDEVKKSNIMNRDLSQKFCSCQTDEICMLNETSGTSICKVPVDVNDPTGCGGLCALETEACHLLDKSHGARVCRQINPVSCSAIHWRCNNGLCVPLEYRCNGVVQCYDRSDEIRCECDLKTHFRCGQQISCFPISKICDGFVDCWDGYDEQNCTTECPQNQFTCNDGQCVPSARFCDGVVDCDDGTDEPGACAACGLHEMRCNNKRCILSSSRCNGRNECGDNTDELNCP